MAQSWKYAVLLGLVGVATAAGCTVKEGDDDDIGGFGGESGDAGTGGTSGKGGSAGKGGTAGTGGTAGSAGKGGTGGTAGKGGAAGTGGTTAGSSGEAGGGGEGGDEGEVQCDPASGNLDNTPYPDCEPANDEDECGACIQENCCEESKECYGYEPNNVCGWGGPEGRGEIDCYQECMTAYVAGNDGLCDIDGQDSCLATCTTPGCGVNIGNQTNALASCINSNCPSECLGADDCE
jgi:hypothetical protein